MGAPRPDTPPAAPTALPAVLLLLAASCLVGGDPATGGPRRSLGAAAPSTGGAGGREAPEPPPGDSPVHWSAGDGDVAGVLQVPPGFGSVVHLGGTAVHDYLDSLAVAGSGGGLPVHCLVLDFPAVPGRADQYRARAVPVPLNDFASGSREYALRIDLHLGSDACRGPAPRADGTAAAPAFRLDGVCPGGCGRVVSTGAALYVVDPARGGIGPDGLVRDLGPDLVGTALAVNDALPAGAGAGRACTDRSCRARGFDCCLEGQCVDDRAERPGARARALADPAGFGARYDEAVARTDLDAALFADHPDVFYVCPLDVPAGEGDRPSADALAAEAGREARERLERETREWRCLEAGKEPDGDLSPCGDRDGDRDVDGDDLEAARRAVWRRCGCRAAVLEEPWCPDFGLKVETGAGGEVTAVLCDVPPPVLTLDPQQDLDVAVATRSVPHRFFREDDGEPVDDLALLAEGDAARAEGTPFSYLDERGLALPQDDAFNMNAVLGQMRADLGGAFPAKAVAVEFGQDYVIMGKSGVHSPCPRCPADSWFGGFLAHPPTEQGMGLRSAGSATRRDAFGGNASRGNYEDTLFGRACWVPPTMIPFTHRPDADAGRQRRGRLAAQAALYVNGYQRDWYGFNKGALIGSFDGVSWFAVGTGRRVTATSDRLFLAVNAPFGDLAELAAIDASVVMAAGDDEAASADHDFDVPLDDPAQNQGATCQRHHLCETDLDCATRLGWEYLCADVSFHRTSWPRFDSRAREAAGEEAPSASFADILHGDPLVRGDRAKRCVYRGAGAVCARNALDPGFPDAQRRLFACAPNFHCEELDQAGFNARLVREPDPLRVFLFGREADVLGRPLSYMGAREHLPAGVVANIRHNASRATRPRGPDVAAHLGLCRPGKDLSANDWRDQQTNRDPAGRTDFINQIGSCDSGAREDDSARSSRVRSCPTFVLDPEDDEHGNYVHFSDPDPFSSGIAAYRAQNMCGGEAGGAFGAIEAGPLAGLDGVLEPVLPRDACLKRAGSPCFTDLDCAPGRMHAAEAEFRPAEDFGGSVPEFLYWTEPLVCSPGGRGGAADGDADADGTKKCCREEGGDFTMFTEFRGAADGIMEHLGLGEDQNPDVDAFPGEGGGPGYGSGSSREYSRYAVVDMLKASDPRSLGAGREPRAPVVEARDLANPTAHQWRTLQETGEKTCCGGGWIRKFADGDRDWIDFKKLRVPNEGFRCLNYFSPLIRRRPSNGARVNWKKESANLCPSPASHGCVQTGVYRDPRHRSIQAPRSLSQPAADWRGIMEGDDDVLGSIFRGAESHYGSSCPGGGVCGYVDTSTDRGRCGEGEARLNPLAPYFPLVLARTDMEEGGPTPTDACVANVVPHPDTAAMEAAFSLPVYIDRRANIQEVLFKFFDEDGDPLNASGASPTALEKWGSTGTELNQNAAYGCRDGQSASNLGFRHYFDDQGDANGVYDQADASASTGAAVAWCVHNDDRERRVLKIGVDKFLTFGTPPDDVEWDSMSFRITFNPIGTSSWSGPDDERQGTFPGNDLYYLTKLGRLELLGIPQIHYEPIYCSHNYDRLLPGIYAPELYSRTGDDDRAVVEAAPGVFDYSPARHGAGRSLEGIYDEDFVSGTDHTKNAGAHRDGAFMYADMIDHPPIFSPHEFSCCRRLGEAADSPGRCCSGFGVPAGPSGGGGDGGAGGFVCKLPNGTNLNVYFNRFVSNEGEAAGGLDEDEDFVPETGEVRLTTRAYAKLNALGARHCDSGDVVRGALFGHYQAGPSDFVLSGRAKDDTHPHGGLRYSMADEAEDVDGENGSGHGRFAAGLHWDHHVYCGASGGGGG